MVLPAWLFAALYFPALQLLPLALWHSRPRSETILQRMAATSVVAAALGWVPTARRLAAAAAAAGQPPPPPAAVAAALGLRLPGLGAACVLPLALTALLLAGPLLSLALSWRGADTVQHGGDGSGSGPRGSGARRRPGPLWRQRVTALPAAARVRNWLAAPLLEEFLFRGCLLSFLLSSGVRATPAVALSPLLFAASHLHHWRELVQHQGLAPRAAAAALAFQLAYTTLFGWLAAFLFVRSRHLAAAVLPHALCNVVGPPGPPRARGAAGALAAAALPAGAAAFCAALGRLTRPELYANGLNDWLP